MYTTIASVFEQIYTDLSTCKRESFVFVGEAVHRWIRHHFSRANRAKCLIIIGPTGTGKTSFALSLPGRVNYFKGRWNLDRWNDYARYSVYDDIPWDQFANLNFPHQKGLLTQNGKLNVRKQRIAKPKEISFFSTLGNRQISRNTRNQCSTTGHRTFESPRCWLITQD